MASFIRGRSYNLISVWSSAFEPSNWRDRFHNDAEIHLRCQAIYPVAIISNKNSRFVWVANDLGSSPELARKASQTWVLLANMSCISFANDITNRRDELVDCRCDSLTCHVKFVTSSQWNPRLGCLTPQYLPQTCQGDNKICPNLTPHRA